MPFCPKCNCEYLDSVKTCPECKVDLVERSEIDATNEDDYVEVYMVSDRMEADLIQGLLQEAGVDVLMRDLRMFPVLPDFGRRVRLRIAVAREHEAQARKLLEEAREDGALTGQGRFL